jgi:glycogen synthase
LKKRKELLKIIDAYPSDKIIGKLTYKNSSIINLPESIPLFVMSGRLDYNQKGYDVFLHALMKFKQDDLKVILTPLGMNKKDIVFFKDISSKSNGNIAVILGKMEKGFRELKMGSSFGIMPSIYEPFGGAVEYLVNGTVVIARKTGGLVDQINKSSGILFRENYKYTIKELSDFSNTNGKIIERITNPWVLEMTESLYKTLKKAIKFYQNQNLYYNMVKSGFNRAKKFDWGNSAGEYFKIFKLVSFYGRPKK